MTEQCPQCGMDRIAEDAFCHKCGHKHIVPPKQESLSEEMAVKKPVSEVPIEESPSEEPVVEKQAAESEPSIEEAPGKIHSEQLAAIWIQIPDSPNTYPMYFEKLPKVLQRQDFSGIIDQREDLYQISRKQCTMSMDGDKYYMEDGTTQVQDRPSTNHTTINGRDITGRGRIMLNNGDKIVFAHTVHAVFRTDGV